MKNLISVYIISKNYGKFVEQSIQSVLSQSYSNWELYLINDNSEDKTLKIFKKYYNKDKKKIKIINKKKNTGLQKISNEILKISNGEFIIRLDADDWLHEDALSIMQHKIESDKNCGVVFGGYYYVNENGKKIGLEDNLKLDKNNSNFPPHGACTLFRCRSLKEVGGYSTKFKAQDGWDIWLKLKERIKFSYINLPLFYYRKHGSSLSDNYKKIIKERGKIIKSLNNKKGDYELKVMAVLPIKKNFIDYKNTPFIKFRNKTLLEHTLHSIEKSKFINTVVVLTTHKDVIQYIKNKSKHLKKEFIFNHRPKKYDKSIYDKIESLLTHASDFYKAKKKYNPDITVFFNLHVVRNENTHIDKAIKLLIENKKDTVFSVTKEKNPIFKFYDGAMGILNKGRFDNLDFNSEIIFKFNNSIITSWDSIIRENRIFEGDLGFIETLDQDVIKVI